MDEIDEGIVSLSDDLVIASGYTFEQFQKTRYYRQQSPTRVFWLDERFTLQEHSFMVSLFFRGGVIYTLSLLCCDTEFSLEEEAKRKELHDEILKSWGIAQPDYAWGCITSAYDAKSNISSITISFAI
jgi:hypothetical protein